MAKINQTALVASWTQALRAIGADKLDRVVKATAREFGLDRKDTELREEYEEVLASAKAIKKAEYVMGFSPLLTSKGIIAFLSENSDRWGIDIPGEVKARRAKRVEEDEDEAPVARKKRATREVAEKPARKLGPVLELTLEGDAYKLCSALGFRKEPGDVKTIMKKTAAFQVAADPDVGIVARVHTANVGRLARFMRNRLSETPRLLRRAVILDKNGEVPELEERLMTRANLRSTTKGLRIEEAA
jgi:hypothetical protein